MKNTTRILAMLILLSFSAFSQVNIQWTGISSSDMSDPENWLTMDGTTTIAPIGNNLKISNISSYNIDMKFYNSRIVTAIKWLKKIGLLPNVEIINKTLIGTINIRHIPILNESINVNSITVDNISGLVIDSNCKLTVDGDLTNNSCIKIVSDSTNTGSIIVKGSINGTSSNFRIERWFNTHGSLQSNWHLVSSPVENAKSNIFKGHFLNYYKEETGDFKAITSLNHDLIVGDGYVTKLDFSSTDGVPNNPNPIVFNEYTPNTGTKTIELINGEGNTYFNLPGNFNLVGNPYTSNLNWDAMWNDPININTVDATLYYYVDDGSTEGDTNGWKLYNANNQIGDSDGYISIAQAFGVLQTDTDLEANGTLTFKSDFQTHLGGNVFHKKSKSHGEYFELNALSNNLTDKIYFKFNENTSDDFDTNHDAYKLNSFGETPTPFFISNDNKRLAICEMPNSESVNLGFLMDTVGEVTFSLTNVQDFDKIIIEDKLENSFTDLTKTSYSFSHNSNNEETGRFVLHFKKEVLSEEVEEAGMKVYSSTNNIYIKSNRTINNAIVNIYNVRGQLVASRGYSSLRSEQINCNLNSGIYIVDITSDENNFTTKINFKN